MSPTLHRSDDVAVPRSRGGLALLVGTDSGLRRDIAHELIQRGIAVVMCSGPPGCALSYDDRCALVDRADVAILLSDWHTSAGTTSLEGCARAARHVIFAHEPPFERPVGSLVAASASAGTVARAAAALTGASEG